MPICNGDHGFTGIGGEEGASRSASLFSVLDGPLNLATGLASFDGFAAVVELFAFGEPEFHLGMAALREVDA